MNESKNGMFEGVAAVVLAAGQSRRMGRPKMILPWGDTTVVGRVVTVLAQAGIGEIVVVTGGNREEVEHALGAVSGMSSVRTVFNPDFAAGEMLSSFQAGLAILGEAVRGALAVLGDQPQLEERVVRTVAREYNLSQALLVVPSVRMRRGHPWLVDRSLWPEVLALRPPQTLRDFLQTHAGHIRYASVETDSILLDLDTPEDYRRSQGE